MRWLRELAAAKQPCWQPRAIAPYDSLAVERRQVLSQELVEAAAVQIRLVDKLQSDNVAVSPAVVERPVGPQVEQPTQAELPLRPRQVQAAARAAFWSGSWPTARAALAA